MPSEEDRVRDSFSAAAGIHRTAEGGFKVAPDEVKKGPSGEEILKKAADEAKNEESTPNASTTRSSLASISKIVKPGISPSKPAGGSLAEKVASTALGSRIGGISGAQSKIARPVQSAK